MKKIFLLRLVAVLLMCLSSLLIKSENVASKLNCSVFCNCKIQKQNTITVTPTAPFYNDDGFFIKI